MQRSALSKRLDGCLLGRKRNTSTQRDTALLCNSYGLSVLQLVWRASVQQRSDNDNNTCECEAITVSIVSSKAFLTTIARPAGHPQQLPPAGFACAARCHRCASLLCSPPSRNTQNKVNRSNSSTSKLPSLQPHSLPAVGQLPSKYSDALRSLGSLCAQRTYTTSTYPPERKRRCETAIDEHFKCL